MKKRYAYVIAILGFLFANASAFAQNDAADIQRFVREQEGVLATVRLQMLHFDITQATGSVIEHYNEFARLEKKIRALSEDRAALCAQMPRMPYRHALQTTQASAARVIELMAQAPALIQAGGNPPEGMGKLLASSLSSLMQNIAKDATALQKHFSELEASCSKEG